MQEEFDSIKRLLKKADKKDKFLPFSAKVFFLT